MNIFPYVRAGAGRRAEQGGTLQAAEPGWRASPCSNRDRVVTSFFAEEHCLPIIREQLTEYIMMIPAPIPTRNRIKTPHCGYF